MMIQKLILTLIICLSTLSSLASSSRPHQLKALQCGKLVDVENMKVLKERTIIVDGERIRSIQKGYIEPSKAKVIDLKKLTCLPGFIDLHVHFEMEFPQMTPMYHPDETRQLLDSMDFAERTLMAGFTTVRDMASLRNITAAIKTGVERGQLIGPTIINAGVPISKTNGHIDMRPKIPQPKVRPEARREYSKYYQFLFVDKPEDVKPWFENIFEKKVVWYRSFKSEKKSSLKNLTPDAIKIAATGGVVSENPDSHGAHLSLATIKEVVKQARRYGKKVGKYLTVAAHAHGIEGIANAVFGGVNTVEHGTELLADLHPIKDKKKQAERKALRDRVVKTMKKENVYLIPTLYAAVALQDYARDGHLPKNIAKKSASLDKIMETSFKRAVAAGVPIAMGSDTGISKHGKNGEEFVEMARMGGLKPLEVIQMGTLNGAKALRMSNSIGSLEAKKDADIVALSGDIEADIKAVRNVQFVMKRGQVYRSN